HVDDAFQAQARRHGGGGHAVLAGAGLGDDPGPAHAAGQQRLADGVVDLVRAGVVQVLALEQDARAAVLAAEPLGEVDRARAADVVAEVGVQRLDEAGVGAGGVVGGRELAQRLDQGLGHEAPAVAAEVAGGVGPVAETRWTAGVGRGCDLRGRTAHLRHGLRPRRGSGPASVGGNPRGVRLAPSGLVLDVAVRAPDFLHEPAHALAVLDPG